VNNTANYDALLDPSGYGGGVYYTCQLSYKCEVNMTNSFFVNNSAYDAGGAIKWDELEPNFDSKVFDRMHNNKAGLYGDNIACFA
jgi:hypothetical protein